LPSPDLMRKEAWQSEREIGASATRTPLYRSYRMTAGEARHGEGG